MRGRPLVAAAAALVLGTLLPAPARAAVPVVVVDGRGFGHGVGMAQDGAFWMGKAGASTETILGHFYPGTALGRSNGAPEVRVPVLTASGDDAVVAFPGGGEIRDARSGAQSRGFPVAVAAGGQVSLRWDGQRYHVSGGEPADDESAAAASTAAASAGRPVTASAAEPASTTTTEPPTLLPTTTVPPETTTTSSPPPPPPSSRTTVGPSSTRTLWAVPAGGATVSLPSRSRTYRGVVEATAAAGPLRLVNQVDVETYLRGMGEVRDPSWPPASLRAQAIAARTYALRAMGANGELCDSQRCQVYLGSAAEYKAMDKAVADTRGQVILHGKALASAVYSSNGGGVSATREEGFGTTGDGYPYLRSAPYTTQDPKPWKVEVSADDVARRFGLKPPVQAVRVSRAGPSGRALEVTFTDAGGSRAVTGLAFARTLGLRSTLFTVGVGEAAVAPAPLTGGSVLQAEPEEAVDEGAQPVGMYFRMTRPVPTSAPPATVDLDRARRLAAAANAGVGRSTGAGGGIGTAGTAALFLLSAVLVTWLALVFGGGLPRPAWLRVPSRLRQWRN